MKVTIIGGGNLGTLLAAEIAHIGHEVTVYTQNTKNWSRELKVYDRNDQHMFSGKITEVTNSFVDAIEDANVIFITTPTFTFDKLSKDLVQIVKKNQIIVMVPGYGGGGLLFKDCIDKGCIFCGLQRVPSIARLKKRGESVYNLGKKIDLAIGTIPRKDSDEIAHIMEELLGLNIKPVDNYLNITLTPSNPLLHTSRLYSMFRNVDRNEIFHENALFYANWTDDASEIFLNCGKEWEDVCDAIPLDLMDVEPIRVFYDSNTPKAMTKHIRGRKDLQSILSPMKECEDGWKINFESRYFTADFSYGLKLIIDIADLFDVEVPQMKAMWNWYTEFSEDDRELEFPFTKKEFLEFYSR